MAKSKTYLTRKTHRFLGLILGIQFLVWTISGMYFSWTDIDEIHGDFQRRHPPMLKGDTPLVSPASVTRQVHADSIHALHLVSILQRPYYSLQYYERGRLKTVLADAATGAIRPAVSQQEAIRIAAESFNGEPVLKHVEYLEATGSHHEYREKPLPAWAVTFSHPSNTTVYVSAAHGKVESFRNNKWKVFDFLWMGHTMDYRGRDDFNNWLLRIFSLFGLLTVISGFILFFLTMKKNRFKIERKKF